MFLNEFEKYNSQYEKGIKKISVRSSYPKIVKEPIDLKLEKSHGNSDLFFNRKGLLLHSVHTEKNKNFKVIYGYNQKGTLISIMKLLSETNELISLSEFEYDEKGRIETETVRSFYYNLGYDVTEEHIHTYTDSKEEIFMSSDDEEEDEHTLYLTYDSKKRVTEEKAIRNEDELVYWNKNEYDKDDNLVKEISLDEHGQPDGVYEFLPFKNGLTSGYNCKSKDSSYLREYSFTLNEKGHWINQVMMNDGEPIYFYDRTIEYY
ncbi:MAG: hypothetical protein JXA03_09970 [Bacteroidales bacterium]|nr:hypothetical protein [Bacteroidales bacterium]